MNFIILIDIDVLVGAIQSQKMVGHQIINQFFEIFLVFRKIIDKGLSIGAVIGNPLLFGYFQPFVIWGLLKSSTIESQIHRELTSAVGIPVGFECQSRRHLEPAVNGIFSSSQCHSFIGLNNIGRVSQVFSKGNPWCHLVINKNELSLQDCIKLGFIENKQLSYYNNPHTNIAFYINFL